MKMTIANFREWVGKSVFTVQFVKKDGTVRVMNAMLGVQKHVLGTQPEVTAKRKATLTAQNMLTVFDMQKRLYRTINLETVQLLTAHGIKLIFEDGNFVSVEDNND
jgi:hypothetical protein